MQTNLAFLAALAASLDFTFPFDNAHAPKRGAASTVVLEVESAGCHNSNGVYVAQGGEIDFSGGRFHIRAINSDSWVISKGHSLWYAAKHEDPANANWLPPHSAWVRTSF
jgi:hypothetical protein